MHPGPGLGGAGLAALLALASALPVASCVTMGKSLSFPEPMFLT